jgi:hypothetical protein
MRIAVDDTLRLNPYGRGSLWVPAAIDGLEAMVSVKCVVVFMYGLDQLSRTPCSVSWRLSHSHHRHDIYENFLFRTP